LFHPETETFTSYNLADGLPNDVVYQIVEDKNGFLWLTTNNGLVCFQPATGVMKVYTTSNGLLGDQFNYRSSFEAEDGTMNTILSLVSKGTMNCAGREFSNTLFGDDLNTATTTSTTQTTTATTGTAIDAAAMAAQRAEAARKAEEERKRLEEEERKRQEEEERLKKEESKKKPSFFKRMKDSLTNFGKSLVEPENDNN
jgi:ligand-binding sensor domain-containing protein